MTPFAFYLLFVGTARATLVDDKITDCLLVILEKYFKLQHLLVITDLTLHGDPDPKQLLPVTDHSEHESIIFPIMKEQKWTIQVYNSDKFVGMPEHLRLNKLRNSVIFLREETLMSDALFEYEMNSLFQNPLWNPEGKNVIIIQSRKNAFDSSVLSKKIIERLWKKSRAIDNLVMVAEMSGLIKFYTWLPYRQPFCSEVQRITYLDTYKSGKFLKKRNLFPKKLKNDLEGCELVVATDACTPYVFTDPNNASILTGGLEYSIVSTLAQHFNFKLRPVRPKQIWTTQINGSLVGAFKLLREQEVDLAFSCLMLNRERNLLAKALPPYYVDSLSWFVPAPEFVSHTTDIFFSLPTELWILVVVTIAVAMIPTVLLSRQEYEEVKISIDFIIHHFIKLIGLGLFSPVNFPAKKIVLRCFIFIFCMYSLHITIAFQSSLFALYRRPRYGRFYSTLEQAVNDGLFVFLRPSVIDLYNQTEHGLWNKILAPGRHSYLSDFGEAFTRIADNKDAVALFIRSTGIYMVTVYFTNEDGTPQIVWLKKKFAVYPVAMYLSPNHPLHSLLSLPIYRLLSCGMIRTWMLRAVIGGKLKWFSASFKNSPLSVTHLAGAFSLLLVFLSLSVAVFLGELFYFYVVKKGRKPKDFYFRKHEHRNLFLSRVHRPNLTMVQARRQDLFYY